VGSSTGFWNKTWTLGEIDRWSVFGLIVLYECQFLGFKIAL
jgi:hypothetical protein